jgi:hypothetical protein
MMVKFGSPTEWQRLATKQWIYKAIYEVKEPFVIIEGQMNFNFIYEAFQHYKFNNYNIVLVDCDEVEMIRRLKENRYQPELANEEMKNWRRYLREQALKRNIPIINTTNLVIEEVIENLEEILKKICNE